MDESNYEFIGEWMDVKNYLSGYAPEKDEGIVIDIEYLTHDIYGVKSTQVYEKEETDQPYTEPFK